MNDIRLSDAKRIVFKVGSSTLLDDGGKIDGTVLHRLAALWASLHKDGKELIIVTSGAVQMGRPLLSLDHKGDEIPSKQAAAAVGQSKLMALYDSFFTICGINVAQILLTRGDFADRHRYINARNTLNILLSEGIIPIINENDTVAWEELKFGENDSLAALVGSLLDADVVCLLSDIYGLYTGDPRKDKNAKHIPIVKEINSDITALAGGVGSRMGSGGMKSKVDAARITSQSGIPLVITMGRDVDNILATLRDEGTYTVFLPVERRLRQRDRWIAYASNPTGSLNVDSGAEKALKEHKSLLPVGIIAVNGDFPEGSVVTVIGEKNNIIGRGIVNHGAEKIRGALGKQTVISMKSFTAIISFWRSNHERIYVQSRGKSQRSSQTGSHPFL